MPSQWAAWRPTTPPCMRSSPWPSTTATYAEESPTAKSIWRSSHIAKKECSEAIEYGCFLRKIFSKIKTLPKCFLIVILNRNFLSSAFFSYLVIYFLAPSGGIHPLGGGGLARLPLLLTSLLTPVPYCNATCLARAALESSPVALAAKNASGQASPGDD